MEGVEGKISVSSPGKVILHGEHSVVYGKLAVALSLDLRTNLTLTTGGENINLHLPDVGIKESWPLEDLQKLRKEIDVPKDGKPRPLGEAEAAVLRRFLKLSAEEVVTRRLALISFLHLYLSILPQPEALTLDVKSEVPSGSGLGSSAAYAVCLAGALLHLAGYLKGENLSPVSEGRNESQGTLKKETSKLVSAWAFESEKIIHGTPSGIDNSICTYGGAISFKAGELEPLQVPRLQILLVNTRVPRDTKAIVAGVKERKERLPNIINPLLDAIGGVAQQSLDVLHHLSEARDKEQTEEAYKRILELVDINQSLLCALGVSHDSLDKMVSIAKSHGLHAKLTGAGAGGFGIIVVHPEVSGEEVWACKAELEDKGYRVWDTSLGAPGLTLSPLPSQHREPSSSVS
ncbi:mevalonate kinase-like [Oratosquilla oratoria]|uniref:mevalonate kinase-like n=1 Tax=Oratosquilla oratoria TaxID=337810 RepID=UPI003F76D7E9